MQVQINIELEMAIHTSSVVLDSITLGSEAGSGLETDTRTLNCSKNR
jgi:hypothetical protein